MCPFPPESALFGQIDHPQCLLEGLFAHSPIGVQLYDVDGHSLFVNKAFLALFGVAPPPEYCVLRDELAARYGIAHLIRDAFEGKVSKLPVTWYDPGENEQVKITGGRRCAVETFMVPILGPTGEVKLVVFFFRDATVEAALEREKQLMQKKLEDAHLVIDGLMRGTQAVIYAKDLEGRYLFVNEQYRRIVNLPLQEIIGRLQSEIFPPEIANKFREVDMRALSGQLELEETVIHPDGSRHDYLSLRFPLTDGAGQVYGVCGVSTDITTVRRLEKELGEAERLKSLGLLAGGVAHDFNNLLGMILLHTESLSRSSGKSAEPDLTKIRGAVERASSLVRQLLAFGGQVPLSPRVLNLNAILQDLSDMLSSLVGASISLELDLAGGECKINADPTQVEQVLLNLCVNSRDALGSSGRIRLSTGIDVLDQEVKGLRLACKPGRYAWFEVADNGPGMPPHVLERAFDPFFTTKARSAGSGLGLASVFGIVRESGGTLRVSSSVGSGCAVRVYFPVANAKVEDAILPKISSPPVPFRGTALLVEDEPLLREITARILRQQGVRVLEARDAAEVPKLLDENPDVTLLLTDVIMPGESGPALVKGLRERGYLKGVGVVFTSGCSSDELARYGFERGKIHFLEKPFTTEELMAKIREALATADPESGPLGLPS